MSTGRPVIGESAPRQHKWNQERWQPGLQQGPASGALGQRSASASEGFDRGPVLDNSETILKQFCY